MINKQIKYHLKSLSQSCCFLAVNQLQSCLLELQAEDTVFTNQLYLPSAVTPPGFFCRYKLECLPLSVLLMVCSVLSSNFPLFALLFDLAARGWSYTAVLLCSRSNLTQFDILRKANALFLNSSPYWFSESLRMISKLMFWWKHFN